MKMLYLLSLLLAFFSHSAFAWEEVEFIGKNYPSEKAFSRELKSSYDLIESDLVFSSDHEIRLKTIVLGVPVPTVRELEYSGKKSNNFLNDSTIKYVNYGVPLFFAAYGILFWDWGTVNGFRMRDEGWFGRNTYAGGADKFAHMYSHFVINRASYDFYRSNGLSHESALKNSFILASTVGLLIEVGDGISHYGFAVNDLISDMAGVGLGYLLNSHPYLDELIGFQLYWWNNTKDPEHKGKKFNDPVDDYNNQKYIFNIRFAAIPFLRSNYLTRYLNFDLGMYSRGTNATADSPQNSTRTLYVGFSLNLTQALQDLFPDSDYAYYGSRVTKYYQPRGTGVAFDKWTDRD
ncbi:MAG: DUF2279 domain-containing protein [Bacteriovoracaceae bacterium]|nr:DUF2279 domain-containing protein [Bacteriovoracaceae bacterium]